MNSLLPTTARGKQLISESIAKFSTWKIGGVADVVYEPADVDDAVNVIRHVQSEEIPFFILGKGSNLMFPDEGIRGVVIKLADALNHLEQNGTEILAGAGYPIMKLASKMSRQGLSGLEFAAGIPATVGGAIFMNAGAHGGEMAQVVKRVHVVNPKGDFFWMHRDELVFRYRHSLLQEEGLICLEAELELTEGDPEMISRVLDKNKQYRKDTQPYGEPSCGSVFKNPLPQFAAKLIEEAGLKGSTYGGVTVSKKHANFIVNQNGGTAENVLDLMAHVQKTVENLTGVTLEPEVQVVRPDGTTIPGVKALYHHRKK
ncbi:UDP-N-acetylmuramate dehydrogenase [Salisediminibacterium beveridgei]|uniref:UDP-N-acetylenolpyruvoylglucosamine reductase n=1 Tax=Salisediminibacterium beveridgei TaxID=632773 RepID=A0A1D7QW82_9BACI|nr:UDP-N-acetylmuramate dehydrogenase [Salisediminibacterium beveridgei]AOM83273.1 UDP-N-acetylenolpyruvoylglucosamine reductase [Salisediminibacterium beveridgei]